MNNKDGYIKMACYVSKKDISHIVMSKTSSLMQSGSCCFFSSQIQPPNHNQPLIFFNCLFRQSQNLGLIRASFTKLRVLYSNELSNIIKYISNIILIQHISYTNDNGRIVPQSVSLPTSTRLISV